MNQEDRDKALASVKDLDDAEATAPGVDPGFDKLPNGDIVIGDAASRASLKRSQDEAFENAGKVMDKINGDSTDPVDKLRDDGAASGITD